ncbi:hypothetical protein NBRC10512_007828 [Rhodotorula toruloides]|uniref:RHTO0S01e18338g1_1 n=2 Tax=Rhodotorula toruloides TaxID=5286 RepID=A0A061ALR1_RHOTO|nr:Rho GTPase-activating protein [Rhodotorula toruloides NP11]EMS19710.1 Rho GTPase-activating protein [Rhodotorula toruloides NP11]CDR36287.1 RHTO0S01e18338g1_1 [Rhodotorula toruloides]
MSNPFPDPPSRTSFSSGRSRSSSNLPADARRPSGSSQSGANAQDPYSPTSSRNQSFSSANGALPGASGSGLVFPGPAQGSRGGMTGRQTSDHIGEDDEEQESLSPSQIAYQQYFPGPPPSSTPLPQREIDPAQYPLPTSRQQSIDSNAGGTSFDIPTFSMPFPPPPHHPSSSSYALNRDPPTPSSLSRSHLAAPGLHKTPSSSSLSRSPSNNSAGGVTGSSYSYDQNGTSPAMPQRSLAGTVDPSPNPSQSSSNAPSGSVSYDPFGPVRAVSPTSSSSRLPENDFERRGKGLGLGRGIMGDQAGAQPERPSTGMDTRRPSLATVAGGGYSELGQLSVAPTQEQQEDLVPTGFDEGVLRALCDMDCGTPLLLERMKQSMASCREASNFLKKRAQIEEEYARQMAKLAKSSIESYSVGDGKAGSYVNSWISILRTHELLGDNRLKFASQLNEMSDELATVGKEVDKSRKATKELGARLEKGLQEQESLVDKARIRFDSAAEELERLLVLKQGEVVTPSSVPHSGSSAADKSKGRSFGKAMSKLKGPKNAAQIAKQEEEVRSRMGQSSDAYRAQVAGAQSVRQEYFNLQLPRILRSLKESVDELDLGTQYHLSRYAYIFESLLVTDGLTVSPVTIEDGPGIKAVIDAVDVREDFKTFMQQYALNWQMSGQRGPRRDGPAEEGFPARPSLSPQPSSNNVGSQSFASIPAAAVSQPTFGVDLGEQMARDNVEVPRILEKCAEAIEIHGLDSMGIYRLSGTTSRVQRLKTALDRDLEGTDLLSDENLSDINDIAAVLKLWFRELPEPLLTWELYHQFIDAAKIENDRLRHIRLHERVNDLPDPNYATLKFLMGHLDKVAALEHLNQMSVSNLSIVFGPNLLGAPPAHLAGMYPPPGGADGANGATTGGGLQDMQWQCKCIETILSHYQEIFVE